MKEVRVTVLPDCDIHKFNKRTPGVPAKYDSRTTTGSWANLCQPCYDTHGTEPTNLLVLRPQQEGHQSITFDAWMREVDKVLVGRFEVTSGDIGDWHYRQAYDDGVTPQVAADGALADDDLFGGES